MRENFSNYLESRKLELAEKLGLRKRQEEQARALNEVGLLEILGESNKMGILGADGKEYPVPSYDDILERVDTKERLEFLEKKVNQGFNQLLLVPFALPLDFLIERYKRLLIKKDDEGDLREIRGKKLLINRDNPVEFNEGSGGSEVIYYPKEYSNNHQGKTKKELLDEGNNWEVLLLEDIPDLPMQGEGAYINKERGLRISRVPFESHRTAEDYLRVMQNEPNYFGERGLTLESWVVYAMTYLQIHNMQIDVWGDKELSCLLTSYFLPSRSSIVSAGWYHPDRQAQFSLNYFESRKRVGFRSSVKI